MKSGKLNIVLLSGSNPYNNAGIWAYDIFKSLTQHGHSVLLLTRNYDQRFEPGIISIYGKYHSLFQALANRILNKFKVKERKDPSYYMHSLDEKSNYIPSKKILKHFSSNVDVIIYLFPHQFLNSRNLYELNKSTKAPIFIIPADLAQLTGGCHYTNKCEGYMRSCGNCPGIYSSKEKDQTYRNMLYKQGYQSKTELITLANTWTSNFIRKSSLYSDKPNYKIDVVVDESTYTLGDKRVAKKNFSIPLDKKVIFFGAASVLEKRKGFSFLVEALNRLYKELSETEQEEIVIAIAGCLKEDINQLFPFQVYSLGHLAHHQLATAYQMSELFISPSIQDAGPMMVIQSMMCGTPVVAFEMGNAVDFIIDGETGYKVPLNNFIMLKDKILELLRTDDDKKKVIAENCRRVALSRSSYNSFVDNLIAAYKSVKSCSTSPDTILKAETEKN